MTLTEDNSGFIQKLFMRHVWPSVTAQIVSTIGPIVCTIIAGTVYGNNGLAVNSLFSPFFFLAGFFGTIIAGGSTTLASKYIAKDDNKRVSEIYAVSFILSCIFAAAVCLLLFALREPVLIMIAGSGELYPEAGHYYNPTLWYLFFTIIIHIPLFWARLAGRPGVALVLSLTMAGTGIALSILFSYGLKMNIGGLAASQAISTIIALIVSLALLHLPKNGMKPELPRSALKDTRALLNLGSPWGLSRLYRFIGVLLLNIILLRAGGPEAVAVYGILNILLRFITAFCNGVTGMASPVAGVLREEHDVTSLKQLSRIVFLFVNIMMIGAAVILYLLKDIVALSFGINADSLVYALVCFCVYIVFYVNGTVLMSWYAALKKVLLANIIAFAQDMAFLPLFALLLMNSGPAIWLHQPLSGVAGIVVLLILLPYARRHHLSFPLMYDKTAKTPALAFSVNPGQASEASEAMEKFCTEIDLEPKKTMLLSMAIEEMITLIAKHIPGEDISVRLSFFDGGIVLRLRTGGKRFNPVSYYEKRLEAGNDIEELIDLAGIKYIVSAAEVIYYTETFGVNNLVIII